MRYRFVGGPKHNEIIAVPDMRIYVMVNEKIPFSAMMDQRPVRPCIPVSRYQLCMFSTEYGTRYFQYVHESLFKGSDPIAATFCEDLSKALEFQLTG